MNIEESKKIFTADEIQRRLKKIKDRNDTYWKVSFEEGIDPTDINKSALPDGEGIHGDLGLKLVHTQWRYDFAFVTPSGIYLYRYKAQPSAVLNFGLLVRERVLVNPITPEQRVL